MDPLGGIMGLIGAGIQSSNQGMATALAYQNFLWQKQQADKQERFAEAGRTDAYGNVQRYDPGLNKWVIDLTPTQNQITKAGEGEQLKSLLIDAVRNRAIKEAAYKRGVAAEGDYNKALAGYRYDQPPTDRAIRGELGILAGSGDEAGAKSGQAASIRTALRAGAGALIPQIVKSTDDAVGANLQSRNLNIRDKAVQQSQQMMQQHDAKYLPELSAFEQIMAQGGDAPVRFSTVPQELNSTQGQQATSILQALQSGASNINGADAQLVNAAGKSPSFGNLSNFFGDTATKGRVARQQPYSLVNSQSTGVGTDVPDPGDNRLDLMGSGNF